MRKPKSTSTVVIFGAVSLLLLFSGTLQTPALSALHNFTRVAAILATSAIAAYVLLRRLHLRLEGPGRATRRR